MVNSKLFVRERTALDHGPADYFLRKKPVLLNVARVEFVGLSGMFTVEGRG